MNISQSTLPYVRQAEDGDEEMMDPNLIDWRKLYATYGSKSDLYNYHTKVKVSSFFNLMLLAAIPAALSSDLARVPTPAELRREVRDRPVHGEADPCTEAT
jgi:hypothetical protein